MKISKEPTLLFVNKHVYAFPKDTYPKYSFPFQKQLGSENTAKMEVLWNDSEKLQAANSLFNQEFGTVINHVPSILMDLNSPAISWNSKLQIEELVPKYDHFLNFFCLRILLQSTTAHTVPFLTYKICTFCKLTCKCP